MKQLTPFLLAIGLFAADTWQTKPFTEWTDKDVQKILTNSPWAHSVSVGGPGPAMGADSGLQGRDTSANRPAGLDPSTGPAVMAPTDPSDQDLARSRRASDAASAGEASLNLTVLWQSALPVKQALARRKYGTEAATSPEAKKFLDDNSTYLIGVSGLTTALAQASQGKGALIQRTTLAAKGKQALHPSDVVFGPPGTVLQVVFIFPRTMPFGTDDKDVEFSTQFGTTAVKYKFRLKDMLFHGVLEL